MEAPIRYGFESVNADDKLHYGNISNQAELVIYVERDSAGHWRITENGIDTLLMSRDEVMDFFAAIFILA